MIHASPESTSSPCWLTHTVCRRTRLRSGMHLDDLGPGRDDVAGLDRLDELQRLRQVDRARTGQLGADDRRDQARGEDARRDRRLERRRGRVGGIAVHGVVVADRIDERRDVVLLDDPAGDLRAVARPPAPRSSCRSWALLGRRAGAGWPASPSSTRSIRSSSSTICLATPVSWLREARLSATSAASIACSPAFLTGACAASICSSEPPIIWAKPSVLMAWPSTRDHASIH